MRVYKFLSTEYALWDVINRRLKISELRDMNDPLELLHLETANPVDQPSIQKAATEIASRFGVICFSRSWKSPLLWARYADKHRGICLGFDVPDAKIRGVTYITEPIKVTRPEDVTEALARQWLFSKFEAWRYEDEARVHSSLSDRDGEHYFCEFGESLTLREIIAGCRFPSADKLKIDQALRGYEIVNWHKCRF
jgi:hypothetical protein